MKLLFGIALAVSFGFNIYFIYSFNQNYQSSKLYSNMLEGRYDNTDDGTTYLISRIEREQPRLLNKKYYFICIWNMACGPCIKEMPTLDSLAGLIPRKDIGYIHLTENSDKLVQAFLKRKHLSPKNFIYMNDANDYIMALIKSQGMKSKGYPLQAIITCKGELKHFGGAFIQQTNDSALMSVINALP